MHIELEVANKRSNVKHLVIRDRAIVGRQGHCDVRVVSSELSREHCRIDVEDEVALLTDLGSTNGTFLNQEKLDPHQPRQLSEDDLIQLGPAAFKVHVVSSSAIRSTNKLMDETVSPLSHETVSPGTGYTPVEKPAATENASGSVDPDGETVPAEELIAEVDEEAEVQFSNDEIDDLVDEEEEVEADSFLAGVTSDADIKTVADDEDAYDRFLRDL